MIVYDSKYDSHDSKYDSIYMIASDSLYDSIG